GEPGINLIEGEIASEAGGGSSFRASGFRMGLNGRSVRPGPATLGLRAEAIAITTEGTGDSSRATVDRVEHLGGETLVHLRGEWGAVVVRAPQAAPAAGTRVGLKPDPARALLFDPSGSRI